MGSLKELRKLTNDYDTGIDEKEMLFLARLREGGVLNNAEWEEILLNFKSALIFMNEKQKSVKRIQRKLVIYPDADPRNASWISIVRAKRNTGYDLPHWAALWLWMISCNRWDDSFWSDVGKVAKKMKFSPMSKKDSEGGYLRRSKSSGREPEE